MITRVLAAAGIGLGAAAILSTGVAQADETQVEGNYYTFAACNADGPTVEVEGVTKFTHYECRQHADDGLWYLYLSN
jgi:hypothetical protein